MRRSFLAMTGAILGLALASVSSPVCAQCVHRPQPVNLRVLLPHADAQLVIDDRPTRLTGEDRRFVSPPLEPNRDFAYTLTATWKPNGYTTVIRTRRVTVRAGQEVRADLRQADARTPDKFLIIFVPTPDEVVEAMCKLGSVGKSDVVYDLGCGDGRIVINAVKRFEAKRGVGVDIDAERVKESKENAVKTGVADRVEIRQGDVLNIKDLAEASVVMLYMGEDVNLRLRPILQKTLKPGSRIVSHRFLMGDWKPLKSISVIGEDGEEYELHLWEVKDNGGPDKEKR